MFVGLLGGRSAISMKNLSGFPNLARLVGAASLATLASLGPDPAPAQSETKPLPPTRTIQFETREATEASIDVAPDGATLVFTLLGDLYRLPIGGGEATPLTSGSAYDDRPRFSPDGKTLAFISDREGEGVYLLDLSNGSVRTLSTQLDQPSRLQWSADGTSVYVQTAQLVRGEWIWRAEGLDPRTGARAEVATLAAPGGDLPSAGWTDNRVICARVPSPDGAWIAGAELRNGTLDRLTIMPRAGGAGRELDSGVPRYHRRGVLSPSIAWSPDGTTLYAFGDGDLRRIPIDGSSPTAIPFQARVAFERRDGAGPAFVVPERAVFNPRGIVDLRIAPPNGKMAVYQSGGDLYLAPFRTAKGSLTVRGWGWDFAPAWNHDAREFAFQRFDGEVTTTWIKGLPKGAANDLGVELALEERPIVEPRTPYRLAAWHPDGERLLIDEPLDGIHRLSILDPQSGETFQLWLTGSAVDPAPFFGPKDQDLYFTDLDARGVPNLFRLPLGAPLRAEQVTEFESGAWESLISPDETQLIFRRNFGLFAAPIRTTAGAPRDRDAEALASSFDGSFGWFFNSKNVFLVEGGSFGAVRVDDKEALSFSMENIYGVSPKGVSALIEHLNLVDLETGMIARDRSIEIEDGKFLRIGPASEFKNSNPRVRLDATGLYAIPGLFDWNLELGESLPRQSFACGVTNALERGSSIPRFWAYRDAVDAALQNGPRLFGSGPRISGATPDAALQVRDVSEAVAVVQHLAESNLSWIELGDDLLRATARAATEEATRRALPVGISTTSLRAAVNAIADGAFNLHGGTEVGLRSDMTGLLAQSGVVWAPSLSPVATAPRARLFGRLAEDPYKLTVSHRRAAFAQEVAIADPASARIFPSRARSLNRAKADGVRLACASETTTRSGLAGAGLLAELEAWVEAGLAPKVVLRIGTLGAAELLGLEGTIGAFRPGNRADLVLLQRNPLEDITAIGDVAYVIKEGRAVTPLECLLPRAGSTKTKPKEE
ncbi:MAG: PD40 domain-containing protein [Candidatus Eisenbacteria bacterium]|nr:PD40 domain-containing protein [Candidatus Eisenbacteria bacterium]